jgi:hypothetical protein
VSIESALYGYLSGYAGLTALVGARVYPLNLPPKPTLPAVTYQKVSGKPLHTMGNNKAADRKRFQFTCWGASYGDATAVAAQVKAALDGYDGVTGGVTVRGIQLENELDDHDPETGRYLTILDFMVLHEGG